MQTSLFLRRTILHLLQNFFTEARTFILFVSVNDSAVGPIFAKLKDNAIAFYDLYVMERASFPAKYARTSTSIVETNLKLVSGRVSRYGAFFFFFFTGH